MCSVPGAVPRGVRPRARVRRARQGAQRLGLRTVALGYLAALLLAPVAMIFYRTFEHGLAPVWNAVTAPNAVHAFWLSIEIVAIAVPLNTAFGIGMALLLERGKFRGRRCSAWWSTCRSRSHRSSSGWRSCSSTGRPAGSATGWSEHGIQVIFSVPGMVIATAVVSLPFVARETAPVLRELGTDAEQAAATLGASTWQTFWRVTLPAIRWGVVYGVVLTTARALGEFGAVSIVSGGSRARPRRCRCTCRIASRTSTPPAPTRPRSCSRCWRWRTLVA